jgi:hypothetical protein
MLPLPDDLRHAIIAALNDDYYEGAVEAVFAVHPDATRDEAVDLADHVERELRASEK